MNLLADHDVWASTVEVLTAEGHNVATALELNLAQAPDRTLLEDASSRGRLLLTRDHDFGRLVFAGGYHGGVLFLRVTPSTQQVVHEELCHVLDTHAFDELRHAFTVVEPGQYRIRRAS